MDWNFVTFGGLVYLFVCLPCIYICIKCYSTRHRIIMCTAMAVPVVTPVVEVLVVLLTGTNQPLTSKHADVTTAITTASGSDFSKNADATTAITTASGSDINTGLRFLIILSVIVIFSFISAGGWHISDSEDMHVVITTITYIALSALLTIFLIDENGTVASKVWIVFVLQLLGALLAAVTAGIGRILEAAFKFAYKKMRELKEDRDRLLDYENGLRQEQKTTLAKQDKMIEDGDDDSICQGEVGGEGRSRSVISNESGSSISSRSSIRDFSLMVTPVCQPGQSTLVIILHVERWSDIMGSLKSFKQILAPDNEGFGPVHPEDDLKFTLRSSTKGKVISSEKTKKGLDLIRIKRYGRISFVVKGKSSSIYLHVARNGKELYRSDEFEFPLKAGNRECMPIDCSNTEIATTALADRKGKIDLHQTGCTNMASTGNS